MALRSERAVGERARDVGETPSNGSATTGAVPVQASPRPGVDDYEEISLVDIAKVIHKRKVALAVTVVLALLGGAAITVFTTPEFEAQASIIPLEHEGIIKSWLGSRQAADVVHSDLGARLYPVLYPDQWDASTESWSGTPPARSDVAGKIQDAVRVGGGTSRTGDNTLTATVTLTDPTIAADVAAAYLASLNVLRPQLENITRSELFDKYYSQSGDAQEAQARAETTAKEKQYWITFDEPTVPKNAVKPRPVLNMALAGVLGVMMGVFLVFGLEWLGQFRTEFQRVERPPDR